MLHNADHSMEWQAGRLQQGEADALSFFFRLHYPALSLYSYRLTGEEGIAEEIAQDAFVKLWQRREQFPHPGAIKAFLFTVTKNASLNRQRDRRRQARYMNEYPLHCEAVTEPCDTEQALSEIHAAVHQAIQQLPPKCREVFRLHYLQGMDYEQIAKELKVSISTVRNQKARALALLRKQMGVTGVLHLLTLVTVS